jgi:hypothetical protein
VLSTLVFKEARALGEVLVPSILLVEVFFDAAAIFRWFSLERLS